MPVLVSLDVRGWHETFPLNKSGWSLFFEYVTNVLYATVVLAVGALLHLGLTSPQGDVIGGWSLESAQLYIGFARMAYPFLAELCFGWRGCGRCRRPLGGAAWQ